MAFAAAQQHNAAFMAPQHHARPPNNAPPGTFNPGTKVQVGNHRVVIQKYLSEGGFAHVYVVDLPTPVDGERTAVLKRVAVPDKDALANMRTEVETMKKLKGHKYIVKYIDSHASQLKGGGYEVFLLMEFCSGGGLIDFMNTRLQNRLTEPEILHIFTDVAEGVACMHYLKPPLLHRDLKVENVLITTHNGARIYKLCDFGSTAPPRPAATSAAEGKLIEDDVQRHTTLQYRSPEMIDVYRKQPIDEKSDIWALGVFLYKLCYYTTPFEEVGQMAILNATFKYPSYPPFSDRLKMLIATMLRENPQKRPNIYQVLKESLAMRGKECPIRDIYSARTPSENRRNQVLPPSPTEATPKIGAIFSAPIQERETIIPNIAPMRRGRPENPSTANSSAKPSPSPRRHAAATSSDPFAALDKGRTGASGTTDELAAKFPSLDQFSLLHEKGAKFEFEPTVPPADSNNGEDLSKRVTHALADEAFVKPAAKAPISQSPADGTRPASKAYSRQSPERRPEALKSPPVLQQPVPHRPQMVSTGTMTSSTPPPPQIASRPIFRFPPNDADKRPSSSLRNSDVNLASEKPEQPKLSRVSSFLANKLSTPDLLPKSPSSRPSLEGSRPSQLDINDPIDRARSANSRARPVSMTFARPDFLRRDSSRNSVEIERMKTPVGIEDSNATATIDSDVDFLRAKEEEDKAEHRLHKRISSGSKHAKRSSLSSISLSGTKTLLAGRFGDAFRRFETNGSGNEAEEASPMREPAAFLTPITGSEATERSDDGFAADEAEEVSPEMRREIERRRLSEEERRVASAAAEYKLRVAGEGAGRGGQRDVPRAISIQNKVQSLLQDHNRPVTTRTAAGYGRYTDVEGSPQSPQTTKPLPPTPQHHAQSPSMSEQPFSANGAPLRKVATENPNVLHPAADRTDLRRTQQFPQQQQPSSMSPHLDQTQVSASSPSLTRLTQQPSPSLSTTNPSTTKRPLAPPKPKNLRPTPGPKPTPATTSSASHSASAPPLKVAVASPPPATTSSPSTMMKSNEPASPGGDDWEVNFSKRYPSLSGLELVETEIEGQGGSGAAAGRGLGLRTREV